MSVQVRPPLLPTSLTKESSYDRPPSVPAPPCFRCAVDALSRWDAALPCPQRRADAGPARRDAPAQGRAACPGGGVERTCGDCRVLRWVLAGGCRAASLGVCLDPT